MYTKWPWRVQGQRYIIYVFQISCSLYGLPFSRGKVVDNWKCTNEMTSDWPWLRNCIYQVLTLEAQILAHFALWPAIFEMQCCQKLKMHLNVKKYPVYTKNSLRGSGFGRFHFMTSSFWDTNLKMTVNTTAKIGNALNDPKLNLNT